MTSGAAVIRDVDRAIIPADTRNADWRAYQAWLAAGGVPSPAPVVSEPVPASVTPLQIVRALRQAGLKGAFDAALAVDAEAKEDFNLAREIERDDPLVASIATALGKTSAEVDDIFRLAATL
ncbi:hypothetical protein [Rhodomicrobium udaipurense]|uniref:Uncharacterized protein n=2 Tax=Rhodomicrobium udaipurense TaxID=1202716 RepID=A0A8I1GCF1_9HYPH|nr:hypothetical protein [Rhodomicrobium udaipurense]MBJ7543270.1 hypothetical protein [Rhodomicrobium udaipurense]